MSAAVDLFISKEWETSIPDVLQAAGFQVTTGSRRFPDGRVGNSYSCVRDGKRISFTEIPLPEDASYVAILGLSRRSIQKHSSTLGTRSNSAVPSTSMSMNEEFKANESTAPDSGQPRSLTSMETLFRCPLQVSLMRSAALTPLLQ
jgi:hypothetical protein